MLGVVGAQAYFYDPNLPLPISTINLDSGNLVGENPLPSGVTFTPGENENTYSLTTAGVLYHASQGNTQVDGNWEAFTSVQSQGTTAPWLDNAIANSDCTFPFLVEGPSGVPVGTSVTVDLTFTLAVGAYIPSNANLGATQATASVTEPNGESKTLIMSWQVGETGNESAPIVVNSNGLSIAEVTSTDTETLSTGIPEQGPYYSITLYTQLLTDCFGSNASAYAYVDPMIQVDPSTPDAQDYQIVLPESLEPVPEPSSFGLVGVGGVGLAGMFILRRRRGVI